MSLAFSFFKKLIKVLIYLFSRKQILNVKQQYALTIAH